jgi:hypothetical protein
MKPAEFLNELSNDTLASYKKKAGADAKKADSEGDYKRGDKRFSGIVKATKKQFANDEKKDVAEGYGRNSYAYQQDGGANDERHDLDPSEWYIVKDGKMYKVTVYPSQEQEARARGYSPSREEAKAKADRQSVAEDELDENCWKGYHKEGNKELFGKTVPNCVKNEDVAEGLDQPREAGKAIQSLKNLAVMKSALTMQQLSQAGRESIVTNAINAAKTLEQSYMANKQQGNAIFVRALRDEIDNFRRGAPINASFPESDNVSELGDLLQGKLGKVDFQQGVAEEQQRLDPKCWKGYKKQGTKMKGGTRVNNCVPVKESAILQGLTQLDEGWKEKLGAAALAGSMALGAAGAHARVAPGDDPNINRLTGKPNVVQTATDTAPAQAEAPKGFSKEYLQKAADPNRTGRYMISVEKAQELLKAQDN